MSSRSGILAYVDQVLDRQPVTTKVPLPSLAVRALTVKYSTPQALIAAINLTPPAKTTRRELREVILHMQKDSAVLRTTQRRLLKFNRSIGETLSRLTQNVDITTMRAIADRTVALSTIIDVDVGSLLQRHVSVLNAFDAMLKKMLPPARIDGAAITSPSFSRIWDEFTASLDLQLAQNLVAVDVSGTKLLSDEEKEGVRGYYNEVYFAWMSSLPRLRSQILKSSEEIKTKATKAFPIGKA
jgi:hypothetical protein